MDVVGSAATGVDAVRRYLELDVNVPPMDPLMPRVGGVEALKAIRAIDAHARVLALITCDGVGDFDRALQAGARAIFLGTPRAQNCTKPFVRWFVLSDRLWRPGPEAGRLPEILHI